MIQNDSNRLDPRQAYAAMFSFLEEYWGRGGSDELGTLLGSMTLQPDGCPADSALWEDWLRACQRALRSGQSHSDQ